MRNLVLSFWTFEGVTIYGQYTKDAVYKRDFHTSVSNRNVDDSGTGRKGDHTGHTGILCPKCKTAGSNLEFFLSNYKHKTFNFTKWLYYCFVIASNRFLRCQRCYHIFKVISAEENNLKDVPEEHNKYKPPPIPKEVCNFFISLVL